MRKYFSESDWLLNVIFELSNRFETETCANVRIHRQFLRQNSQNVHFEPFGDTF